MTDCRITITGRKIWRDGDNVANTRPPSVDIKLFRDNVEYSETVTVDSKGDGCYSFACLPVWKSYNKKYSYRVDEPDVPQKYTKTIDGYNVINTVEAGLITITGSKKWADIANPGGRPAEITVNLLQNGVLVDTVQVPRPAAGNDTAVFEFVDVPQFDDEGTPFVYTVDEVEVPNYDKSIVGFDITNTLKTP